MANQAFFKLKITLQFTGCSFLQFSSFLKTIRLSVLQLFKCKRYASYLRRGLMFAQQVLFFTQHL